MARDTHFSDKLVDYTPETTTGYDPHLSRRDTTEELSMMGARDFPSHMYVEPRDWKLVAERNDEFKTWPDDLRNRFTWQGRSHECVSHCTTQVMEIAYNFQRMSKEDAVWFSPLSLYARCNPRRYGGTTMTRALNLIMRDGILPSHDGPDGENSQKNKFAHTLHQTSGGSDPWVSVSNFPAGWKSTARNFKPLEVINVSSFEEYVSLVLNCNAVACGRWGHSLPAVKIVWRDGQLFAQMSDSYNRFTYDSVRAIKASIGGAFAISSVITPHSWKDPAPTS